MTASSQPGRVITQRDYDSPGGRPRHPESKYDWRSWVPVAEIPLPTMAELPEVAIVDDETASLARRWVQGLYEPENRARLATGNAAVLPVTPSSTADHLAASAEVSDEFGRHGWVVGNSPSETMIGIR
jgi:hypothetical protein